jgi:8-oxo-dGTP diphosphatase
MRVRRRSGTLRPSMTSPTTPDAVGSPRHAVVAIIERDARVLFVQRSPAARAAPGYWTPVSGSVEAGETEREALAREVREEVALEVVAEAKVATIPTHDRRYLLHFWTCRLIAGEARVASDEVADLRWLTRAELRALAPVFEDDVRIVLEAMRDGSTPD